MRPIKLTLKGLNSFIEEQTIDFTRLTDRGLFGIFGPTGSGKSTILDGITLALYGEIARKSSNKMNINCEELAVMFQFQISAKTHHIYSVTRQFKRDKKTGKIKNHYAVIKEVTKETPDILAEGSKGVTAECEKILGLSLEDFTRTVVLPQGRFSEFLKLEGRDRREMLERLFNLQAYGDELSNKLKQYLNKDKEKFNQLTGEINSYKTISPELLTQEKTHLSTLTAQLIALKKKQEVVTKAYKKGERIWQLQSDLKKYEIEQQVLLSQQEQIEDKKLKVVLGKSIEKVRPILNTFDDTKQALEQDNIKKKNLEQCQDQLLMRKKEIEDKFEKARIEQDEMLLPLSQTKEQISEVMLLEKELQSVENELTEINQDLKKVHDKIEDFETAYQKSVKDLEKAMTLLKIKQKEENDVKVESAMRHRVSEGIQSTREILFYHEQRSKLEEECQKEEETYQKSKTMQIHYDESLEGMIHQLRETLEDGKPCPVCGSLHHSEIEYQKQKEKKENDIKALQEKIKPLQEKIEQLKKELKTEDLETYYTLILEKDQNYERVQKEIKQITETVETLRYKKESLLEKKNKWNLSYERGQSKKESKINEQTQKSKQMLERWSSIVSTMPKAYIEMAQSFQKQLPLLKEKLELIIHHIKQNYQTLYHEKESIQKDYEHITRQLIEVQTLQEMHHKRLQLEETKLYNQLQEEKLTLQEVRAFTLSKEDLETLQNDIQTYQERVTALKGSIEAILKQLENQSIKEEEWYHLQKQYTECQKEIEDKTIECTKCQTLVQQIEKGLSELIILQEKRSKIEHCLAIWNDLEKLFKGKKFVEFVATNRLKYISVEASKKLLDITNGIYSLEADENGKFMICDYKNGGAKRDASTLSGGETFLVSLALALSLSAEIQLKGTAPLELFFLDEGFGTLDENLLDVVMNSLESLHHDKLKVGIISHIDSIKERVPVKLILTPAIAGEGGTKVKIET